MHKIRIFHEGHSMICVNRHLGDIFPLQGCYTQYVGIYLSTFRDSLSVPSSRIKQCLTFVPDHIFKNPSCQRISGRMKTTKRYGSLMMQ
jgi:hypothetical protein